MAVSAAVSAAGAAPPAPDAQTEGPALDWGARADGATATVTLDSDRVDAGAQSIRFDTDGAFDTLLFTPAGRRAGWDFQSAGVETLSFRVYADNPNALGFQNQSPFIRLYSNRRDHFEYRPPSDVLNLAQDRWIEIRVPLAGDGTWQRTEVGTPTLANIDWIEIHADTWGGGFTLWVDDLRFDRPPPADAPPAYSVTPVLFVPDPASFPVGYQPGDAELAADLANVEEAMDRIRAWYADALGLETSIDLQPVVLMEAFGGLDAYDIGWPNPERRYQDGITIGNTWGLVTAEVTARGFGPGTAGQPRVTLIFCKGAGGFAGGGQWHTDVGGGMAMVGDWCLDSLDERVPPQWATWWTGKNRQTGAAAHEMGHALGLPHPDLANPVTTNQDYAYTVMGAWWDWPSYPINPADPGWSLRGLHGWSRNDDIPSVDDYQDAFLLAHRAGWFAAPPPCAADFNGDGVLNFFDVSAFLDAFGSQDPASDLDGNGVFNFFDVSAFLAAFNAGCPGG